jgi:Zn-dependent peptidase ImmA (M78 family)
MGLMPLLQDIEIDVTQEMPRLDVADYDGSPSTIAQLLRATWRLPMGPIVNLTRSIEAAGGLIIRLDLGTRLLDAVSHWPPGAPPLLLVNAAAPGDRLRFSLAHELGHLVMHATPTPDMEHEADLFAAEFLMPAREIRGHLAGLTLPKAAQLKPYWRVSIAALVLRARDLGAIPPRKASSLFMELSRLGYRLAEPVPIPVEEPLSVRQVVDIHLREHGYSVGDLGMITGLGEFEVRRRFLAEDRPLHAVT